MKLDEIYNHTAMLLGERYESVLLKENSKQDVEEFKKELKEKFFKKFKGLLDAKSVEDESLNFSLESALYWFGNDYHSGQSDIWYSVLSTSDYKPGRSMESIEDEDDSTAEMFYDFLEKDQNRKEKRVDESVEKDSKSIEKRFPGIIETIYNALKKPTFDKGPIEYIFPKTSYINSDVVKEFYNYFKYKGYKLEIGTDKPYRLYFDRNQTLKESKNPTGKMIKISYEKWDEDAMEAGDTDDRGWEDEVGIDFSDDPDETPAKDAIKYLRKKGATNPSSTRYASDVWYSSEDKDFKTGDVEIKSYHLYGDWTEDEKKEIFKGIYK